MNIYVAKGRATTFIKTILLKLRTYIDPHRVIVECFYTLLSPMDGSLKQKVNRDTEKLTEVMNQIILRDI